MYNGKELADLGDSFTVTDIRKYYSREYPELLTAGYTQNFEGDVLVIKFDESIGTKG